MQLQQLHQEIRKLRRELELSYESREDLQDELKEMTQMYLTCKQERDQYKAYIDRVRRDMDHIDRIVKENVDRAVRAKDKQIAEMIAKFKEQQERVTEAEARTECYGNTIKSLEAQIQQLQGQLEEEQAKNARMIPNPLIDGEEDFEPFDFKEDDDLKGMHAPDDKFLRKINEADSQFVRSSIDKATALRSSQGVNPFPQSGLTSAFHSNQQMIKDPHTNKQSLYDNKENLRTTELGEDPDDEATNVRLREDSESTMMFDFSRMRSKNNNSNVSIGQVQFEMGNNNNLRRSANFPHGNVRPSSTESGKSSNGSNKIVNSAKKGIQSIFGSAKKNQKVIPYQK